MSTDNDKNAKEKTDEQFDVLKSLTDAVENSPEQALIYEIESIKWSFRIFRGNFLELVGPLKLLEEKPEAIKLWSVDKKKELYRVFEEVGRLLFNFVASAMMLVDHTRRHVRKLYTGTRYSDFLREYDDEVKKRFASSANHQLAQGLRDYIQHRNLPPVGSRIAYNRHAGLSKMFRISTKSLLEWDKWKPLARAKLENMDEHFPLRQFAEEYYAEVESFYKWLWNRQAELHREDVERLNKMKEKAREAFRNAGLITDEELQQLG